MECPPFLGTQTSVAFVDRRVEAWGAPMSAKRSANATHCRTRMAKVEWSTGIDSVSGALSKPSKSGQHSCTKMLLGTHRTAPTTSSDCNRLFMRKKTKRSTPVTSDEILIRNRFSAVSRAVAARRKDLSHITTDVANFRAQKDQPYGKKTLTAYLWKICGDTYDQQNG